MTTPIEAAFDVQRTAIEATQSATRRNLETQKAALDAMTEGLEQSRTLADRNAELSRTAVHAMIDGLETAMPEEAGDVDVAEMRRAVDEEFDAAAESREELLSTMTRAMEESTTTFDAYADSYADALENAVDALIEQHEQIEAGVVEAGEAIDDAAN